MAWVKLDDTMPTHPKVLAAGPQAFALDVAGICYSNKHATDGVIAKYALPAVLPGLANPKKVAAKLVEVGRWVEVEDGWEIHDVHEYQPTAAEQKEVSRKRAEAGRKGGSKSKRPPEATDKQSAKQVASVPDNPDPTRPEDPPPGGNGEPFERRLADELREHYGQTFGHHDQLHDAFQELLAAALERLPPDRHHSITMGLITRFVERATGQPITTEARSHTARLVRTHKPATVLRGFGEAMNWGAGTTPEYADDPTALSKYVAGVLSAGKRGAA